MDRKNGMGYFFNSNFSVSEVDHDVYIYELPITAVGQFYWNYIFILIISRSRVNRTITVLFFC